MGDVCGWSSGRLLGTWIGGVPLGCPWFRFLVASRAVQSKLAGPFLPGTWGTELGVLACMGCLATKPMPCPLQRGPPTIG